MGCPSLLLSARQPELGGWVPRISRGVGWVGVGAAGDVVSGWTSASRLCEAMTGLWCTPPPPQLSLLHNLRQIVAWEVLNTFLSDCAYGYALNPN